MSITIAITGQALIHQPLNLDCADAAEMLDFLKADATIGNFEGVIDAPGAWPTKTKTVHAVKEPVLASLAALGFSAMAHANNHAFDLGPPGIAATHAAMQRHNILLAGSGQNLAEAARPVEWSTHSKNLALFSVDLGPQADIVYAGLHRAGIAPLRVRRSTVLPDADYARLLAIHEETGDAARLAARRRAQYSPEATEGFDAFGGSFVRGDRVEGRWTVDPEDLSRLVTALGDAKRRGNIVLLALHNHHWDSDWATSPGWLDGLSRHLVDAGADVIIGTGAPVMQPLSLHRNRAIMPGLGNLIFHTARAELYDAMGIDVWRSVAVRLTLDDDGAVENIAILPLAACRLNSDGRPPALLKGADAEDIVARFMPGNPAPR
ncbi:CapA family protein [Rhizobium sp. SL42]|uniref:CapA family protein n=1 Tax=Rhizobium sp. SL42 TaxID=2806346 RepID=UPI001F209AF5|nr:CapA family protein [Rhizobium sp. SL42]UJW73809.1 CapA family protein [Rhizobium sp. SL42]